MLLEKQTFTVALICVLVATFAACSDETEAPFAPTLPPPLTQSGAIAVRVVIPVDAGVGLTHAAEDMSAAFAEITGVETPARTIKDVIGDSPGRYAVLAVIDEAQLDELGQQGYAISMGQLDDTHYGLTVTAATETGAMYGLYEVLADLGVRYHHPEESFFPEDAAATLPWNYDGSPVQPRFELRGFHEHTQHPIVYSDFYLRPKTEFVPYLERYVRWLARNRQNVASWQMLKTVDLVTWLPYITDFVDMAHEHGVRVGWVGSFVDQQQHSFKHIQEDAVDGDGDPIADETQIADSLDLVTTAGFDFLGFAIGSSEFTKPADADVLRWINFAASHLGAMDPPVDMYAWIHTTCDLESEDGGLFFHLPLEADPAVGAWVHTTMFHDLEHPAPVYGCESFHQQRDFLAAADGERKQIYFPETAWWLGFDNNMPLVLPLTGWTRGYDIQEVLGDYDVEGHITFTTGREWGYWMYDHYLTRVTWDDSEGWDDYLAWIGPMFGEHEETAVSALSEWTELQRQHFFDDNPLIYFYLAGERTQDEIGEMAGILARRPKLSFRAILDYDDDTYDSWVETDFELLGEMRQAYATVLGTLPAPPQAVETLTDMLYTELYVGFRVYVSRIAHSVALYGGVSAVREWYQHQASASTPDDTIRARMLQEANARLAAAQSITADVAVLLETAESRYRYPIDLLARDKPETLTTYPFGYLAETSSAYFWTRRDEQLETLIGQVFETIPEEWTTEPDLVFITDPERAELLVPDDQMASEVITGFIPQMLFGLIDFDDETATPTVVIAQDYNENHLPDPASEQVVEGTQDGDAWTGSEEVFSLTAYNSAGEVFGDLHILHPQVDLELDRDGFAINNIHSAILDGAVPGSNLVDLVMGISGIDEVGATNLVKSVFGFAASEDLPAELPIRFRFGFVGYDELHE